jgi:predicted Zn-dependent protease
MKPYIKITTLFIVVAVVLLLFIFIKESSKPESAIIAAERAELVRHKDDKKAKQNPVYASNFESKMRFIDYRLAVAYNSENRPDDAIVVLQRIISEESMQNNEIPRRSRSYTVEAQYYEALAKSYVLKKDPETAEKAMKRRDELLKRAMEIRKIEDLAEGKSIKSRD